ncbi:hypothetical protein [Fimbriiglobus ruber]|uniref:Uncharacterized protein n=1 Tax=Fimbriiglobus ruber TaxID=1908690 RepID=A0A225DUG6_9BACT|nr:hypothetical protein [Fimbriiglobus ruber]OWK45042.1 hypothetical protein FRUB_01373 [Fimbriiglobus ruber]
MARKDLNERAAGYRRVNAVYERLRVKRGAPPAHLHLAAAPSPDEPAAAALVLLFPAAPPDGPEWLTDATETVLGRELAQAGRLVE